VEYKKNHQYKHIKLNFINCFFKPHDLLRQDTRNNIHLLTSNNEYNMATNNFKSFYRIPINTYGKFVGFFVDLKKSYNYIIDCGLKSDLLISKTLYLRKYIDSRLLFRYDKEVITFNDNFNLGYNNLEYINMPYIKIRKYMLDLLNKKIVDLNEFGLGNDNIFYNDNFCRAFYIRIYDYNFSSPFLDYKNKAFFYYKFLKLSNINLIAGHSFAKKKSRLTTATQYTFTQLKTQANVSFYIYYISLLKESFFFDIFYNNLYYNSKCIIDTNVLFFAHFKSLYRSGLKNLEVNKFKTIRNIKEFKRSIFINKLLKKKLKYKIFQKLKNKLKLNLLSLQQFLDTSNKNPNIIFNSNSVTQTNNQTNMFYYINFYGLFSSRSLKYQKFLGAKKNSYKTLIMIPKFKSKKQMGIAIKKNIENLYNNNLKLNYYWRENNLIHSSGNRQPNLKLVFNKFQRLTKQLIIQNFTLLKTNFLKTINYTNIKFKRYYQKKFNTKRAAYIQQTYDKRIQEYENKKRRPKNKLPIVLTSLNVLENIYYKKILSKHFLNKIRILFKPKKYLKRLQQQDLFLLLLKFQYHYLNNYQFLLTKASNKFIFRPMFNGHFGTFKTKLKNYFSYLNKNLLDKMSLFIFSNNITFINQKDQLLINYPVNNRLKVLLSSFSFRDFRDEKINNNKDFKAGSYIYSYDQILFVFTNSLFNKETYYYYNDAAVKKNIFFKDISNQQLKRDTSQKLTKQIFLAYIIKSRLFNYLLRFNFDMIQFTNFSLGMFNKLKYLLKFVYKFYFYFNLFNFILKECRGLFNSNIVLNNNWVNKNNGIFPLFFDLIKNNILLRNLILNIRIIFEKSFLLNIFMEQTNKKLFHPSHDLLSNSFFLINLESFIELFVEKKKYNIIPNEIFFSQSKVSLRSGYILPLITYFKFMNLKQVFSKNYSNNGFFKYNIYTVFILFYLNI
jgi:hypothetical protein